MRDLAAQLPGVLSGFGHRRLAVVVGLPLAALGLVQLLPETGPGAGIRLAAAAVVVLVVPGAALLGALRWPESLGVALAASLAWSLVLLGVALALTFAAGGSLTLTLVLLAAFTLAGLLLSLRQPEPRFGRTDLAAFAGVALGALPLAAGAWYVHRTAVGDSLFHVGYTRKLEELPALDSLEAVGQLSDGGLHPGYAFPLWHGALAAVTRLSGVDAGLAVLRLGPLLTVLSALIAYGLGVALFRRWAGGVALAAAFLGLVALGTGRFGLLEALSDPEGAARGLLVPALLALVFAYVRRPSAGALASVGAAALVVAVVHPNYAPYTALLLAGCLGAALLVRRGLDEATVALGLGIGVIGVVTAGFLAWLWPAIDDTAAVTPSAVVRARDLAGYPGAFTGSPDSFTIAPEAITLRGGLAVAGLLALPLAALAGRRLWAALVLGGSLLLLLVLLVPPVFTLFADVVSVSQSRRLVPFLPLPVALAGAAVLAGQLRGFGALAALGLGFGLREAFPPGREDAAAWPVWAALAGAALGLACAVWRRPRGPEAGGWAAVTAVALILPFALATFGGLEREPRDALALSPGLVRSVRALASPDDVVMARAETAYRLSAAAPLFVVSLPISHTVDTEAARPRERLRDTAAFFAPESSETERRGVLERYGVDWLVIDKRRGHPPELDAFTAGFETVYEDGRFVLLRTGVS